MGPKSKKSKFAGVVSGVLAILFLISGCGGSPSLQVEGTSPQSEFTDSASSRPMETVTESPITSPFGATEMRDFLLTAQLETATTSDWQLSVKEILADCPQKCLSFGNPLHSGGERYQVVSVHTSGDGFGIAGFVVANVQGQPDIRLEVRGTGLWLEPGSNGSVVASDRLYLSSDAVCCPSGWRVRIYQNHDGDFAKTDEFAKKTQGGNS